MIAEDVSLEKLKVGDPIRVTIDGRVYDMVVWRKEPPMSAGRRESAGPYIMAHIAPGRFGVGFDYSTRLKVEKGE